nr:hypothetical protein [Tanacetum cinerariifolium]
MLQSRENDMEAIQVFLKNLDVDDNDEDYYKESIISMNTDIFKTPPSIVITISPPVLPITDPEDSLIMGNEELNTIPKKELNEFIKYSVEDFVPILSDFEDTSGSDSECILPSCDDFSPIDIPEEKSMTFSNPLFNSNDDFTSSDDELLSDEDVPKDNVKIYSNRLFKFDDEYISSDVNPLFDDVLEDIECKDSYDPILDESTFLITPLFDSNEDEYFTPGDDIELLLHHDPSIPKMSIASILEGFTYKPPLEENDDLFDFESKNDEWKKILYDAQIDDLMFVEKVFDPGIHDQIFSPTYVSLPFTDRHYIFFTYVVRILLLCFTYPVVSPFLISSGSEDTIFDLGIFTFHFSHRSGTFICFNVNPNILNENPIEICSSTRFTPNIMMIWGSFNGGNCSGCSSVGFGNNFVYDLNPSSDNDSPNFFNHPPQPQYETYSCKLCGNDSHYGYDCLPQSMNQNFYNSNSSGFDQFQPVQYFDIHQPPEEISMDELKTIMQSYYEIISQRREQAAQKEQELLEQEQAVEENQELLAEEQAANPFEPLPVSYFYNADYDNISTPSTTYTIHLAKSATIITNPSEPTRRIYHNHDIFYDGDDDNELFPEEVKRIQQILEKTWLDAITPEFPITNSLNIGDERLRTILETESNELINSSVENLVPNLSESEDLSKDLSDIEKSLLNQNNLIISSPKFNSLLEEFFDEIAHIDLIPPGINEADFDLEEEIHLAENLFDSLMEEIDLFLTLDDSMPPGIKNDDYDSEEDILFLKELLINNSPSLPENESFHFDVPSSSRPLRNRQMMEFTLSPIRDF